MKKKRKRDVIALIIGLCGLLITIFAGYKILIQYRDYKKSNDLYSDLEDKYVKKFKDKSGKLTENNQEAINWYELADVDIASLKNLNSDIIGWIFFENEDISYPILFSGDNEKYLRTSFDGSYATAGSLFVDGANNPKFDDSHTIIYGHNMKNLSMFGKLKFYNRDEKYYDTHQFFQILTDECIYRYQIFAYETVDDNSFIYSVPFAADDNFQTFILKIKQISQKDTGIEVSKDNKIITLSTCSTNGDQYRFVVHAVRVDTYDKEKINEE